MRFDDDDLAYYSDEDASTEELIEDVISYFKGKVSASEAERVLELNDYDYDATIAKLEANLAKKAPKTSKPAPKPTPKPAAKPAAEPKPAQKSEPAPEPKGKLTRLQELAQRRKAGQQGSTPDAGTDAGTTQSPETQPTPKLSGLARLAAARAKSASPAQSATTPASTTQKGEVSSRLAQLRKRKDSPSVSPEPAEKPTVAISTGTSKAEKSEPRSVPLVSYEYKHMAQPQPSHIGRILSEFDAPPPPNTESNAVPVASQAQSTFSKPSPDEAVAAAQASAFGDAKSSGLKQKPLSKPAPKPVSKPAPKKKESPKPEEDLDAKLARLNIKDAKPHVSFVVIGHVDAGKSTLMGRLLLDTGAVSQKLIDKYTRESAKEGKSSFALAWVLDATEEERRRGVTVDIGEASFETDSTEFTVVDAPGHKDYVPNMIAGVAQADIALLVVDAAPSAFETGFSLDGQTKEHAVLARALGIETCVVAINKLDTQDWSKDRFDEITTQLQDFLAKSLGFSNVSYVPTSGRDGTNVVKKLSPESALAKWYKGPTLVSTLSSSGHTRARELDAPFRFLVSNAFVEPYQSSTTVTGRVMSGILEAGDVVSIVGPDSEPTKVKALESKYIAAGQNAQFKADFEQPLRPGDVLAGPNANLEARTTFVARVRLFDMPRPVLVGTKLSLHMGRVDRQVRVAKIIDGLDKHGQPTPKKPRHLGKGTAARVELELDSPAVLAPPSVCRDLGRFVLRHNGQTVGGGMVE